MANAHFSPIAIEISAIMVFIVVVAIICVKK